MQHPRMTHVHYSFERANGRIMIHMACAACGERLDWMCKGGQGMPEWRVNEFANMHGHGVQPHYNPMPGRNNQARAR